MQVERIRISRIKPAAYNPRKNLQPGDPEYEHLKASLDHWDLVEPLVWNRKTGNLISGHQRLKILKARGDKEVEVSVVSLSESEEKALNIALNKISGDWDLEMLSGLLVDLEASGFDLELTGFDSEEIEDLMTWRADQGEVCEEEDPDLTLPEKPGMSPHPPDPTSCPLPGC